MSFTIISASSEKSQEFAKKLNDIFVEYASSLPEFTPSGNTFWIRENGETSMRRISFNMTSSTTTIEEGVVFGIKYGYGMGSNMDCLIASERFMLGFKKLVKEKLGFDLKCPKYDKTDSRAICGHPWIGMNIRIDSELPSCLCVDPRHTQGESVSSSS